MRRWTVALALAAMAGFAGCDSDGGGGTTDTAAMDTGADAGSDASGDTGGADAAIQDTAVDDTATGDTVAEDTIAEDTALQDTAEDTTKEDTATEDTTVADAGDAGPGEDVPPDEDAGPPEAFEIRIPGSHQVECPSFGGGTELVDQADADHLCTFAHGDTFGQVYVQASASGCEGAGFPSPVFEVVGAWISIDGKISALNSAAYDWGGNHHNDFLDFSWDGKSYRYYHSSFGWGWRACQPMDCMQVLGAGDTIVEDGCTKDRTLPVTCVLIGSDGSVPPLTDTFEPCAGDPNYP